MFDPMQSLPAVCQDQVPQVGAARARRLESRCRAIHRSCHEAIAALGLVGFADVEAYRWLFLPPSPQLGLGLLHILPQGKLPRALSNMKATLTQQLRFCNRRGTKWPTLDTALPLRGGHDACTFPAEGLGSIARKKIRQCSWRTGKLMRSAGRFFQNLEYNFLILHNDQKHRITSSYRVHKKFYAPKLLVGSKGWRLFVGS